MGYDFEMVKVVTPDELASIPLGYPINYWDETSKNNMMKRLQGQYNE